ncbi:hypothetical protein [Agromyces sp. ZXT2-6]|uniref:hypothetical protein n=1 Tax=Agromyces sp. ZXT2-6 TaxID=3461153 RepID=UPI004054B2FB
MHAAIMVAALAPTLASVACTVVPVRRGGAAVPRERGTAVLMGVSALDMVVPGLDLAHATGWGALLVVASLMALVPVPGRARRTGGPSGGDASRRAELARNSGSLLVMAAMWWAMAAPPGSDAGAHSAHAAGVPLGWAVVAVAAAIAATALASPLRRVAAERTGPSAWRHPLMAVGMLAMAVTMPLG